MQWRRPLQLRDWTVCWEIKFDMRQVFQSESHGLGLSLDLSVTVQDWWSQPKEDWEKRDSKNQRVLASSLYFVEQLRSLTGSSCNVRGKKLFAWAGDPWKKKKVIVPETEITQNLCSVERRARFGGLSIHADCRVPCLCSQVYSGNFILNIFQNVQLYVAVAVWCKQPFYMSVLFCNHLLVLAYF